MNWIVAFDANSNADIWQKNIETLIDTYLSWLSIQEQLEKIWRIEIKITNNISSVQYASHESFFSDIQTALLSKEIELLWLLMEDQRSWTSFWNALEDFFVVSWENDIFQSYTLTKIDEISSILDSWYIDPSRVQKKKMEENAIRGYVDALWDPYTSYLSYEENQSFLEASVWSIEFEWIWAVVVKKHDGIMIEEVLNGSPAHQAWLKQLDTILEIDWTPTKDLTLFEWVNLLRWEWWTKVLLSVYAYQTDEILDLILTRSRIVFDSVTIEEIHDDLWNSLYIKINTFWDDVPWILVDELEKLDAEWALSKIDNILLDLRWNAWWDLLVATEVASFFLPNSSLVTSVQYESFSDEKYFSKWYPYLQWIPTIVLVDDMSASASELVAWALRDNRDVLLVWMKTFGKSTIQTFVSLQDWSSLKYTIGRRLTPWLYDIHENWLIPDIEIEFNHDVYQKEWRDNQLEEGRKILFLNK